MEINLQDIMNYSVGILLGLLLVSLIKYNACFIYFIILIALIILICIKFYYYESELLICRWLLLHFKDSINLDDIDFESVDFDDPESGSIDVKQGDNNDEDN